MPRQFDHSDELVSDLQADVSHYHVNYAAPIQRGRWTVIHHHGTEYRLRHDYFNETDEQADASGVFAAPPNETITSPPWTVRTWSTPSYK